MKKELKLPFVSEIGENISEDLVSALTVCVAGAQPCDDCHETPGDNSCEGWTLLLEARNGDLANLLASLLCPECGRKRLAYMHRRKECELEFGHPKPGTPESKRADLCVDSKESFEEQEDDES